jgi:hypothetical protein
MCIVNKADFQAFVYDRVALEAVFEFVNRILGLSNLLCNKKKDYLFLATLCKHLVQIAFLCFVAGVVLIVTMPEFWAGLPLGNGIPFCWHTKRSMVAR